ncbi:MAG: NUDIX domain-containing protein [Halovenus sp.]
MLGRQWAGAQTAVRSIRGVAVPRRSGRDGDLVDSDALCPGPGRSENAGRAGLRIRPGAKALVSDGERFLLVRERRSDGSSFWTLPGGGVRPGESAEAGLRRELVEELQCRSRVDAATGTFSYRHTSQPDTVSVYTVFGATLQSCPRPNRDEGVLECQWVSATSLPEATLPQVRRTLRRVPSDPGTVESTARTATPEEPISGGRV